MRVTCSQLDPILERQDPAELAALEVHAATCEACREQLALDREISSAAKQMQRAWESPALWPRIRERLAAEPLPITPRWKFWTIFESFGWNWQMAAATAVLAVVALTSTWLVVRTQPEPGQPDVSQQRLLTEEALDEVERTEAAYVQSIDRLAALAAPKLEQPDTPVLANYREKLLLLDSAIAECRAQLEQNSYNGHLRRELLAIYQMKQATLTEVLQEVSQ